jgi:23S rRNA-/tRNA-specific pseudouridylate synthase
LVEYERRKKKCLFFFRSEKKDGILAIDKPYGLPSTGGPGVHLSVAKLIPSMAKMLKIDYELYMMHRLDENTTGVMMFAT